MRLIEDATREMDQAISQLPGSQIRSLNRSLRFLSAPQILFAHAAIDKGRRQAGTSSQSLRILEHCLECWHAHSLATKLVVVEMLTRLAGSPRWPDDTGVYAVIADTIRLPAKTIPALAESKAFTAPPRAEVA